MLLYAVTVGLFFMHSDVPIAESHGNHLFSEIECLQRTAAVTKVTGFPFTLMAKCDLAGVSI